MRVYLAGHMPKKDEKDWRASLTELVAASYVNTASSKNNIDFLIPKNVNDGLVVGNKHDATATKDEMYLNICDVAVVNLDLDKGKCLGAMWEFGFLHSRHIPIILWNHHPEMSRTRFLEHKASIVVNDEYVLADLLIYMANR